MRQLKSTAYSPQRPKAVLEALGCDDTLAGRGACNHIVLCCAVHCVSLVGILLRPSAEGDHQGHAGSAQC